MRAATRRPGRRAQTGPPRSRPAPPPVVSPARRPTRTAPTRPPSRPVSWAATPPDGEAGALRPGQTFGPRYRITSALGQGGMGEVYEAWDNDLGVPVALKVIRQEVMQGQAGAQIEQRFKKELLLARQVTHRNVVRIPRPGRRRGHQVHLDGLRRRLGPVGPARRARHAARAPRSTLRAADRRRPRRGPRGGSRAPRPEAGQHHDQRRRRGADHGLRHRRGELDLPRGQAGARHAEPGALDPPVRHDRARRDRGHRRLHGARAGPGAGRRPAIGRVLVRADPLRLSHPRPPGRHPGRATRRDETAAGPGSRAAR